MKLEHFKILLDTPARQPALGFNDYTVALCQIIEHSQPQFAIGIFGGWGSGKTTLLQSIENSLNKSAAIAVRFNAWRYEKEQHLIIPLLDVIREQLVEWGEENSGMKQKAFDTAVTVGKVMHSLIAGLNMKVGIPHAAEISFDANKSLTQGEKWGDKEREARTPKSFYHASFLALRESFDSFINRAQRPLRIVVFIDDLDRCLPQGALEVLESMKLFFDLEGFVFVVGLDQGIVEWSIDSKYRQQAALEDEKNSRPIRGARLHQKDFPSTIQSCSYRCQPA